MGGLFSSKKKTETKQPNRVTEQDKAVLVSTEFFSFIPFQVQIHYLNILL